MILLVSGGLDSYIAGEFLKKEGHKITPLFINYSGRYTAKEEEVCKRIYPDLIINNSLNFSKMEIGDKAFIKNRNAHFALIASNYGTTIVMGGLKDDNVGDKSPIAYIKMKELLNTINLDESFNVISPFWRATKSSIINWYINAGVNHTPIEKLLKTTSCYHPTKHFCGECPSCFRKWCAFSDNNISFYLPMFNNKELVETYLRNIDMYDQERQKSIKSASEKMGVS